MKSLEHIVNGVNVLQFRGDPGQLIARITLDSRMATSGCLFVALRGHHQDGHDFIPHALKAGATAIVAETEVPAGLPETVHWVRVEDSRRALSRMAGQFYDHPSRSLHLIGVTGTNGKTSVVFLLDQLFTGLGYRTGLLSTIEIKGPKYSEPASLTTPDILTIQSHLRRMANEGATHVFMEVSSHAVHQGRIDGLQFAGGIFTNLTHDHLDYHGTFDHYLASKKAFFDGLSSSAFALINADDRHGRVMVQNCAAKVSTYSMRSMADFRARILEDRIEGMSLRINDRSVACRLSGQYNGYNLLSAYGASRLLGNGEEETLTALSDCRGARGRLDVLRHPSGRIGVVDFAHTPDALDKVIQTLDAYRGPDARLITVVGCGGDRDPAKRPLMGGIAAAGSHTAIFTSDNPRSEDVGAILDQMDSGVAEADRAHVQRIADRRQAIQVAVRLSRPGDMVLVAGKGHETYQEIDGVRTPFDDTAVLNEALEILAVSEQR